LVLPVLRAHAEELAAHEAVLADLDKACGGKTVWRAAAAEVGESRGIICGLTVSQQSTSGRLLSSAFTALVRAAASPEHQDSGRLAQR
jgi:hypothetical protein